MKYLFCLFCFILSPLMSWADTTTPSQPANPVSPFLFNSGKDSDPRPDTYPTTFSHDPIPYKMKFFHDTRHWYICFEDNFFMHDPDCPCHTRAKYVTYEMDKNNVEIQETKRVTYQLPHAWDWR